MNKSDLFLGFYGFARGYNFEQCIDVKNSNVFIYCPDIKYENDYNDKVSVDELKKRFGENANINIYPNYEQKEQEYKNTVKNMIEYERLLLDPTVMKPYRLLSLMHNISNCAKIIEPYSKCDSDIIVLCRIDVRVVELNMNKIKSILVSKNIIVSEIPANGRVKDYFFIFYRKYLVVFIKMYENILEYLKFYFKGELVSPFKGIQPEWILSHYFRENKLTYECSSDCFKACNPPMYHKKFTFKH